MKPYICLLAIASICRADTRPSEAPSLTISTVDVTAEFAGAPLVQSFSFAQWEGRWVIIGGRIAGYHGTGGGEAEFLRAHSNREVWVIDTTVKPAKSYHVSLDRLSPALSRVKEQWGSTAQLSFQDGPTLYIAGGYGQTDTGVWVTFPLISKVQLPQLIKGVMQGKIPEESITFGESPLVQSTGGELVKLSDGFFYVVMGHLFQGSYTTFQGQQEQNQPAASQVYLAEIRKLQISETMNVKLMDTFRNPEEFHRRDLNVTRTLGAQGLGLAVFGGVFTPKTQLAYTKPIYLFPGAAPYVDESFEQKMNSYACAHMLMYDPAREAMYTTFFGGISRYYWDLPTKSFTLNAKVGSKTEQVYLDGLQWSDQISTIRKDKEATTEIAQPVSLPGFIGTDAVFVPAAEVKRAHPGTDILDLRSIGRTRTLVGYIYGGVRASPFRFPYARGTAAPYNSGAIPTKPSDLILAVYVENAAP